jgi:hypothetical protein
MPKYDIDKLNDKYKQKIAQSQTSQEQPSPTTPEVSQLESAIRGGAQGLAFGFPDEATAALERLVTGKPYEQALQESRQAYKQAQEANPITYTGSEIAGGVLPALIPGVGQAATGAKLGRLAAMGAGTGALSGLGYSEGQDIGQVAKDVGIGGLLGGSLSVLGRGVQSAIQGVKPAIDTSIKSGLSAMTGKTLPYLEKVESQPERIKKIEKMFPDTVQQEIDKLANNLTELVDKNPFRKKASLLSTRSYKILQNEKDKISIPKQDLLTKLDGKFFELAESSSKIDNTISQDVSDLAKKLSRDYKDNLDGVQAKNFIRQIDTDISALSPKPGEIKQLPVDSEKKLKVLQEIRNFIDEPLKQQSTAYSKAMEPTADATNVSKYLEKLAVSQYGGKEASSEKAKKFIQKKLRETNLQDSQSEEKALRLMQEELIKPRYNNLQGIEKLRNVNQTLADLKLLQEIQATGAIGSSVTNRMLASGATFGGSLGSLIGGITGGGSGAATGGALGTTLGTLGGALIAPRMEREGGRFAAKVLERTKGIRTQTAIPEATQRGFQAQQGLQRGLLDQFLTENAGEVRRKKEMESKFQQDNQNRVKK